MRAAVSLKAHSHQALLARPGAERADPPPPLFLIKGGKFELPPEEGPEETVLDTSKPELYAAPAAPLAEAKGPTTARNHKWVSAIVASCLFHAGVAGLFLHFKEDLVQLAGAEQAGVSMAGNAAEDQLASGEMEPATNVTLIPMIQAEPVRENKAETIQPAETAAPTQVAEVPVTERIEAVEEQAVQPAEPLRPAPEVPAEPLPESTAEAPPEAPVQAPLDAPVAESVRPVPEEAPAEAVPQALATDRVEPVEDDNVVPPVPEEVAESPTEKAVAPVEEEEEDEASEAVARQLAQLDTVPVPTPRPIEKPQPKKTEQAQVAPAKAPAPKKQAAEQSSGSGGRNQADAKRGSSDGSESGNTAVASRGSRQNTTAGNAAVSNYPGKIVSRLRRSLRYPAEARRQRLRGEVHVAFTVAGNGSVGSVRVVRSSGVAILDSAAIETVRRAAPFPPIPAEAGRSSWPFTVPLAFKR